MGCAKNVKHETCVVLLICVGCNYPHAQWFYILTSPGRIQDTKKLENLSAGHKFKMAMI